MCWVIRMVQSVSRRVSHRGGRASIISRASGVFQMKYSATSSTAIRNRRTCASSMAVAKGAVASIGASIVYDIFLFMALPFPGSGKQGPII